MLTARQNFEETIKGGSPDRYVNQYEYMEILPHPALTRRCNVMKGQENVVNDWGVTFSWRDDQPGAFPVHTPGLIVCEDVEDWKECVKAPAAKFSDADWEPFIAMAEQVDRENKFVAAVMAPGVSEMVTHLCGMEGAMCAYYESPEETHDLIKYLTDYEIQVAEDICDRIHPEIIFHHDDWGSSLSTFYSPELFEEYFVPAYKQIYGTYRDHGVKYVVHHSDSFAATFVPAMIEMGIDVWQGVLKSNDIPSLIKQYGGQISFMGGIENSVVDRVDWTPEKVNAEVRAVCEMCGTKFFIPCVTGGSAESAFPGVYECVTDAINEMSKELFA